MAERHLILCGGEHDACDDKVWGRAPQIQLNLGKRNRDVRLEVRHISEKLRSNLPPIAVDLLEIAAYIYAADQAITRGGRKEFEYGYSWRRYMRFQIPVRCPEQWNQMRDRLQALLSFLSDDDYEFGFIQVRNPKLLQQYMFDDAPESQFKDIREVMLFSGGLDSLCGADQEIVRGRRRVTLVSHRSCSKVMSRQQSVLLALQACVGSQRLFPLHVSVEVNKGKQLSRDVSQRTRSFLFASVAAVVAHGLGLNRIRFYENGVTSLNLPINPQLVGARCSRTTHPRSLQGFARLFSSVFQTDGFVVENPFQLQTKSGILADLKATGRAHLCARTCSCAHTIQSTIEYPHCGRCSQCVERRLTALGAGLDENEDPRTGYHSDVLTGPREGADFTLIESYYETALRLAKMEDPIQLLIAFPELTRALPYIDNSPTLSIESVLALVRKHGSEICKAVSSAITACAPLLAQRELPPNCLVRIALGNNSHAMSANPDEGNQPNRSGKPGRLILDSERFEVLWEDKDPLFLGDSLEFRALEYLQGRVGKFVGVPSLRADVWQDHTVEKNAIQRTMSRLRLRLQRADFVGVCIVGAKDSYCLSLRTG